MKRLNKLQIKILGFTTILCISFIIIFYFYSTAMTTQHGNLNINKMTKEDKIYSYSVYSDFYYKATKYDKDGKSEAIFSQIIPIETSIGYDFSQYPIKLELKSREINGKWYLNGENGDKISNEVDYLNKFSQIFGNIVATQDPQYLKDSYEKVDKIVKDLYGQTLLNDDIEAIAYYQEINTAIPNLKIKHYKLDEIEKNLQIDSPLVCNTQWCPNIAKWEFGESDKIYLQYLLRVKHNDIDDYLKNKPKENTLIVNTVRINNNTIQKFFFEINDENSISSYFMDSNGYLYILKYKANNKSSFKKYLPDYLKIAFGIHFIDLKNFSNDYAKEQEQYLSDKEDYIYNVSKINSLDQEEYSKLFQHFNIISIETIDIEKYCTKRANEFDEQCFYELHKLYTSYNLPIAQLKEERKNKELVKEAYEHYNGMIKQTKSLFNKLVFNEEKTPIDRLKDRCRNIECLKELKSKNWEE